jgi:hypothetical protein
MAVIDPRPPPSGITELKLRKLHLDRSYNPTTTTMAKKKPAKRGYEVVRCVAGASRPRVVRVRTLTEARKKAKTAGVIRDRSTGRYVVKKKGAAKELPPDVKREAELRKACPVKPAPKCPAPGKRRTVRNEKATDKLGGLIGRKTWILTTAASCLNREPARFRLVELAKLVPSHSGTSFKKTPGYPEGVQERRYDTDKAEQMKVQTNAQASCFEPAILANTDPTPLGGAPIATQNGIVLGGNSRTMVLQRVYAAKSPAAATEYKNHLKADASDWGFDPRDVDAFKQPALVRVVQVKNNLKGAVRRYNEGLTQELDITAAQVAVAARIDQAIVDELARTLPDDATITEYLKSNASRGLVRLLQQKSVITPQQKNKYIKGGLLNEDGRRMFGRAMVGRILPNADALDLLFNATPSLRNNLARAVPFILVAASVKPPGAKLSKWDISHAMADAARLYSAVKSGGVTLDRFLKQPALFSSGTRVNSASVLLADILLERNGVRKLADGFKRYADMAIRSQTKDLFGGPPPPVQALSLAFKLPVKTGPEIAPRQRCQANFHLQGPGKGALRRRRLP